MLFPLIWRATGYKFHGLIPRKKCFLFYKVFSQWCTEFVSHCFVKTTGFREICRTCGSPKFLEINTAYDCESRLLINQWILFLFYRSGKSAMLVLCGCKDELEYREHKRARSYLEATILGTMATLVAGFTPLNYHKN